MTTSNLDLSGQLAGFEQKIRELNELKNRKDVNLYEFCKKNGFHSPFNARNSSKFKRYQLKSSKN